MNDSHIGRGKWGVEGVAKEIRSFVVDSWAEEPLAVLFADNRMGVRLEKDAKCARSPGTSARLELQSAERGTLFFQSGVA